MDVASGVYRPNLERLSGTKKTRPAAEAGMALRGVDFAKVKPTPDCSRGFGSFRSSYLTGVTFETRCTEGELTFGGPFQGSGVEGGGQRKSTSDFRGKYANCVVARDQGGRLRSTLHHTP